MSQMLKFVFFDYASGGQHWDVLAFNGKKIGQLHIEVDGFWVFYPEINGGFWDQRSLQELADKLKELNAPWEEYLARTALI